MSRVLVLGGSRSGSPPTPSSCSTAAATSPTWPPTRSTTPTPSGPPGSPRTGPAGRSGWTTLETTSPRNWCAAARVLVDSITTWVAALMDETGVWDTAAERRWGAHAADRSDGAAALDRLAARCDALVNNWVMTPAHVVAVSDEVGPGRGARDPRRPARSGTPSARSTSGWPPPPTRCGSWSPASRSACGGDLRGHEPARRAAAWTGPAEAFAVLSIARVPGGGVGARGVLPWAPLVGLVLGATGDRGGRGSAARGTPARWSAPSWRSPCSPP